jgi:hypothetical protein
MSRSELNMCEGCMQIRKHEQNFPRRHPDLIAMNLWKATHHWSHHHQERISCKCKKQSKLQMRETIKAANARNNQRQSKRQLTFIKRVLKNRDNWHSTGEFSKNWDNWHSLGEFTKTETTDIHQESSEHRDNWHSPGEIRQRKRQLPFIRRVLKDTNQSKLRKSKLRYLPQYLRD